MKKKQKLSSTDVQSILLIIVCITGSIMLYRFSIPKNTEQDYPEIRAQIPLENADTVDIYCAGSCIIENEAVVWYVADYENAYYIPLECNVINYSEYQLIDYREALSTNINDIMYTPWKDGYSIIINNNDCIGYEIKKDNGEVSTVELDKESIPHILYVDDIMSCSFFIT